LPRCRGRKTIPEQRPEASGSTRGRETHRHGKVGPLGEMGPSMAPLKRGFKKISRGSVQRPPRAGPKRRSTGRGPFPGGKLWGNPANGGVSPPKGMALEPGTPSGGTGGIFFSKPGDVIGPPKKGCRAFKGLWANTGFFKKGGFFHNGGVQRAHIGVTKGPPPPNEGGGCFSLSHKRGENTSPPLFGLCGRKKYFFFTRPRRCGM